MTRPIKHSSKTRKKGTTLQKKSKPPTRNPDQFSKIQAIIARQLKKSPTDILPHSKLQDDLGADSLDAMEIIFQLEEDFNIKIAEEDAGKMTSVEDIAVYISKKTR